MNSVMARTVHVQITPRPRSMNESRRVLRLLEQQFGGVVAFKNVKVKKKTNFYFFKKKTYF